MTKKIAISGKGGAGKTTLAAMLIRLLCEQAGDTVLAVDADPNACLGLSLGVEPEGTIAEIREETVAKKPDEGTERVRSFQYGIQQIIAESKGFDLITIGRPEGPGCYCAINNLLRKFLDELSGAYQTVVIDNEAGMEHLSRRTANNIDLLCVVAEPNPTGIITAERIIKLAATLPISIKEIGVIWNKANESATRDGVNTFGFVPYDESILQNAMQNKTVFDLDENSPALSAMRKILNCKLTDNQTK